MILVALLAAVTATYTPAAPTVGDPITVTFAAPVRVDESPEYEIVSQRGNQVVVRSFRPQPFALSGVAGGVRFAGLTVPMRSVLRQGDDLKPAPLTPPAARPHPHMPFIAIGAAALAGVAAWLLVWRFARKRADVAAEPMIAPEERFRRAVAVAKSNPERWAALADATRAYLAATRPRLGSDLTTTELVPRLQNDERIVLEILRQGDLEKFSIDGAEPEDFDDVARRALELAS